MKYVKWLATSLTNVPNFFKSPTVYINSDSGKFMIHHFSYQTMPQKIVINILEFALHNLNKYYVKWNIKLNDTNEKK